MPAGELRQQQQQQQQHQQQRRYGERYKTLLAGGLAGAIAKTCTAPLGRLTVLYQVASFEDTPGRQPERGVWSALRHIVRTQGVLSLWRGHMATLLHRLPYSAVNFAVFEASNKSLAPHLRSRLERGTVGSEATRYLIAGAAGGSVGCMVAYPLDLIKTRLMAQLRAGGGGGYGGIADAAYQIVRQSGFRGLYCGLGATLFQVTPTLAVNFAAYELSKASLMATIRTRREASQRSGSPAPAGSAGRAAQSSTSCPYRGEEASGETPSEMLPSVLASPAGAANAPVSSGRGASPDPSSSSAGSGGESKGRRDGGGAAHVGNVAVSERALVSLAAGSFAGLISSTLTFPLDVIRRNAQMPRFEGRSYAEVVAHLKARGGLGAFYKGLLPEYLKVVPSVSIAFCSYEVLKSFLGV